jgi:tetratricopeptide (TPR) repeat protein
MTAAGSSPSKRDGLVLGAVAVAWTLVHLRWIAGDRAPMPFGDCYIYLKKLWHFAENLPGIGGLWEALGGLSHGGRPPLYQLATVPLALLWGRSEAAALAVNVVFFAVLLVSTYGLARAVAGSETAGSATGLLAALLVVTYPPVVQLSRIYLPHFAVPAMVALALWLSALVVRTRSPRVAWGLGAAVAAGLFVHPYFAYAAALPVAAAVLWAVFLEVPLRRPAALAGTWAWLRARLGDRLVTRGLLPAMLLAGVPFVLWYGTWGREALDSMRRLGSAELADYRGFAARGIGFAEVEPSFWWYAETSAGALSNVLAAAALAGLVAAQVRRRLFGRALAASLLVAYAVYGSAPLRGWIYFAAALPLAAVLSAVWIGGLRRRWLRRALAAAVVMAGLFDFVYVTWGPPWGRPLAAALGAPDPGGGTCGTRRDTVALCPSPAVTDAVPWGEVLRTLLEDPACSAEKPCVVMAVGRYLKASKMGYQAALAGVEDRLRAIGPSTKRMGKPYRLESLLDSDYLLYQDAAVPAAASYSYDQATVRFLRAPPPEFAEAHVEVATFDVPASLGADARLVRRVQPLTAREAEASIDALELEERYKSQAPWVLARLYLREGRQPEALAAFREILAADPDHAGAKRAVRHLEDDGRGSSTGRKP